LIAGIAALGLTLPTGALARLTAYIDVLHEWNQHYNLTAVRDPAQMISRHVLDSLAVAPFLQGHGILDAGSGAGLPGIPLAVAFPDRHFTLLDSNGKKIRFLTHATRVLGLENTQVMQARAEDYRPVESFATVISRALAPLADFLDWTAHLGAPGGRWLAMKGAYPEEELQRLPAGFRLLEVHPLKVPGLDARRCVVEIAKLWSGDIRRDYD
jgi:16S rRNA (guanine527-N7)-methyltransferase